MTSLSLLHCSTKLNEHFKNISDLNGKENHVGYLYTDKERKDKKKENDQPTEH